jgi:hypothetical protein
MFLKSFINGERRDEVPAPELNPPAGATPPAEPPTEPVVPPVETPPDVTPEEAEVNLWDQLSQDIDEPEDLPSDEPSTPPAETPPAEPAPETPPVEPEVTPPVEPPATPPVETPPATPEVPPGQPTTPPEPEPTATPPVETPPVDAKKQREDLEASLEQHFALNEEDALQLVTDPAKAFPKLQARMFADMWTQMSNMIYQALPTAIERNIREIEVRNDRVDAFFKAWPKLNKKDHGKTLAQVSKVYANVNPNATEEDVIKYVGMQVMLLHGMAPDSVPVEPPQTPPGTPTPPATPPEPDPNLLPPHQPAAVTGVNATQKTGGNLWEGFAEELLQDDDD